MFPDPSSLLTEFDLLLLRWWWFWPKLQKTEVCKKLKFLLKDDFKFNIVTGWSSFYQWGDLTAINPTALTTVRRLPALKPITSHKKHTHEGQWGDKQPISSQSPANDNRIHIFHTKTCFLFPVLSPTHSPPPSSPLDMFNDFSCHTGRHECGRQNEWVWSV